MHSKYLSEESGTVVTKAQPLPVDKAAKEAFVRCSSAFRPNDWAPAVQKEEAEAGCFPALSKWKK